MSEQKNASQKNRLVENPFMVDTVKRCTMKSGMSLQFRLGETNLVNEPVFGRLS